MKLIGGLVCLIVLLSVYTVDGQPSECPPPPCEWNHFMPSTWPTVCGGIYSLCGSGKHQSPIDIDTSLVQSSIELADLPLVLHYEEVYHTKVVNMGTTIHVEHGLNNTLTGGPLLPHRLTLKQLQFHAPGEHRINGAQSAAEVHLIHSSEHKQAVVVVKVQPGTANPWFDQVFTVKDLPMGSNGTIDINPLQLFPEAVLNSPNQLQHSSYYYYNGSLTSPPCTENVAWLIFIDPIYASQDQIEMLKNWEGMFNRPIQTSHNSTVYRPHYSIIVPAEVEDIRYMGMVISVSFLIGLGAFFGIIGIAILALHLRDTNDKRDFYGAQKFELAPTSY